MRWIISEIAIVASRMIKIVIILFRYLPIRPRRVRVRYISPTLNILFTLNAECELFIKTHIAYRRDSGSLRDMLFAYYVIC